MQVISLQRVKRQTSQVQGTGAPLQARTAGPLRPLGRLDSPGYGGWRGDAYQVVG